MKKLILILLPLILLSCADDPVTPNEYAIDSPPAAGGSLDGRWLGQAGMILSNQGLFDPHYGGYYATDLRIDGNAVWFRAQGYGQQYTFSGTIQDNVIRGMRETANWSPSQGVTYRYPARTYIYTRIE